MKKYLSSFLFFYLQIFSFSQAQPYSPQIFGCKIYSYEKKQCLNCYDGYKLDETEDCLYDIDECHKRSEANCKVQNCLKLVNKKSTLDHKLQCEECVLHFILIQNECIYDNASSQDLNLHNMNSDCIVSNCSRCVQGQRSICMTCQRDYFLKDNYCVDNCGEGNGVSYQNRCFKCKHGLQTCNQEGEQESRSLKRQLLDSTICNQNPIDYQNSCFSSLFFKTFEFIIQKNSDTEWIIVISLRKYGQCFQSTVFPLLSEFYITENGDQLFYVTFFNIKDAFKNSDGEYYILFSLTKNLSTYYTMTLQITDLQIIQFNSCFNLPLPSTQLVNSKIILNCNFDQICQKPKGCYPNHCLSLEVNSEFSNPSQFLIILVPYFITLEFENNKLNLQPDSDFEFDNSESNRSRFYFFNKILQEGILSISCYFKFPKQQAGKDLSNIFYTQNQFKISKKSIEIKTSSVRQREEKIDFIVIGVSLGVSILSGLMIAYCLFIQNLQNNKKYYRLVRSNDSL